jgi:hypothetical protein
MLQSAQVVGKSEFAALRGVSPGRVSQWLAEGKIKPDALVGEGRSAKINVEIATRHLKESLDPSQRFGLNGISTKLDLLEEPPADQTPPAARAAAAAPARSEPLELSVEEQIKREKLRQAQLATARAEEQDRLSRGVYIIAADARDDALRAAAQLVASFDGAVPDLAAAIAAKWQLPARDVTHLLRAEFRKIRARVAAEFAELAAAEAETVDDPNETPAS